MGVGYEFVDQALNGGLLLKTMAMLCLLKLAATIVSYASGNAGGIFALSLYIGAMAGGAIGVVVHTYAPFPTGDPGAYALVGMGTLFAGIIRAPMTSVFMIFEITQDYQILVPLMLANMLSLTISRRYQPVPVYHALLRQDNVHLPGAPVDVPETRTARHFMRADVEMLPADLTVESALTTIDSRRASAALVADGGGLLAGRVTRQRLQEAVAEGRGAETIGAMADADVVHVHPDHSVELVLDRFSGSGGLLPVVSRGNTRQVEGVVTLETIASGFDFRRQDPSS